MFFTLLLVTFILTIIVSLIVVSMFRKPIDDIFERIIKDPISKAWQKYVVFATFVAGISGGVRIYQLERYINPHGGDSQVLELTSERWTIEIYRTIIDTLQSIAWMYLWVFIVSLIAYVIVRVAEMRHEQHKINPKSDKETH